MGKEKEPSIGARSRAEPGNPLGLLTVNDTHYGKLPQKALVSFLNHNAGPFIHS